jgi:hypothetical protein
MCETTAPRCAALGLVLLIAPTVVAGQKVPARLLQAQYVAFGYDLGDRFLSEFDAIGQPDRLGPDDRKALQSVREMVDKWDRYVIVTRPSQAELYFVVRVGRRLQAGTAQTPGRGGQSAGRSSGYGAELSSRDDMLSVYEASLGGGMGMLLWRGQLAGGLGGESPKLLEQFKADLDAAKKP